MPEIQPSNFSTENRVRATLQNKRFMLAVHIHQFAELIYVIEGELTVKHDKIEEVARAGDVVAILPYQQHGFYTPENKTVKYWMVLFSEDLMSDIVYHESAFLGYKHLVFKPSPALKTLIELKMFDTGEQLIKPDFERTLDSKALIYTAFSEYLRKRSSNPSAQSKDDKIVSSDPVTKTVNYLRINFRSDVGVEDCAKEIGYSKSHISHCLREQFHMTFMDLRNTLRVGYAKHILRNNSMSIYMVALECGFNCELTFERAFKKLTGLTPRQYRRK